MTSSRRGSLPGCVCMLGVPVGGGPRSDTFVSTSRVVMDVGTCDAWHQRRAVPHMARHPWEGKKRYGGVSLY